MNVSISVRQLGRKYPILNEKQLELDTSVPVITTQKIIELVVKHQVDMFNRSSFESDDQDKTHHPKENYLSVLTDTGKAGFGAIYNHQKPDLDAAVENALLAFQDGIYTVFYGDDELSALDMKIDLQENKPLTFIRLTFLAGGLW